MVIINNNCTKKPQYSLTNKLVVRADGHIIFVRFLTNFNILITLFSLSLTYSVWQMEGHIKSRVQQAWAVLQLGPLNMTIHIQWIFLVKHNQEHSCSSSFCMLNRKQNPLPLNFIFTMGLDDCRHNNNHLLFWLRLIDDARYANSCLPEEYLFHG